MAEHTPGPWLVEKREAATDAGTDSPGSHGSQTHLIWTGTYPIATDVVAHIVVDGEIGQSEADANARLISAAPTLLNVVKLLVASWDCDEEEDTEYENLLDEAVGEARRVLDKLEEA
jgi:hypothetical protein